MTTTEPADPQDDPPADDTPDPAAADTDPAPRRLSFTARRVREHRSDHGAQVGGRGLPSHIRPIFPTTAVTHFGSAGTVRLMLIGGASLQKL